MSSWSYAALSVCAVMFGLWISQRIIKLIDRAKRRRQRDKRLKIHD